MDADAVLESVFDVIARETSDRSGALKVLHKNTVLNVCGAAALQKTPTAADLEELKDGVVVRYSDELPLRAPADNLDIYFMDNKVIPAFFNAAPYGLPDASFVYIPVCCAAAVGVGAFTCVDDSMVLNHINTYTEGDASNVLRGAKLQLYRLRKSILDTIASSGVEWANLRPSFAFTTVSKMMVLVLCGESSLLYTLPPVLNRDVVSPGYKNVIINNEVYMLDGWNPSDRTFSTITYKGGSMAKGLLNPTKLKVDEAVKATIQQEVATSFDDSAINTQIAVPDAVTAAPHAEDTQESSNTESTNTESTTDEVLQKKPRRRLAKKTDFTEEDNILASISASICDESSMDTKVKIDKLLHLQAGIVSMAIAEAQKAAVNAGAAEEKLRLIHSIIGG